MKTYEIHKFNSAIPVKVKGDRIFITDNGIEIHINTENGMFETVASVPFNFLVIETQEQD